jgi:hypothetical protein
MVKMSSAERATKRRSSIALLLIVAAFGVACNGQDESPLGDFESAGVTDVQCQRTADSHFTCRMGSRTIRVERSNVAGGWVESGTHTDLHDYLVMMFYGPPECNAPDCP